MNNVPYPPRTVKLKRVIPAKRKIIPPHQVTHPELLDSMISTLMMGGELPPIYTCRGQAFSGSHRLAAWAIVGLEPACIEISTDTLSQAALAVGSKDGEITPRFDLLEAEIERLLSGE